MTRTITVTPDDCRDGVRGSCSGCPLALAVARALPGSRPLVSASAVWLTVGGRRTRVELPEEARRAVWVFDLEQTMRPFVFSLDV